MIKIKRVYEKPAKNGGFRILVDRLWPRGVSKKEARVDVWLKDIAPSSALRKWFNHDPTKWLLFQKKYKAQLLINKKSLNLLKEITKKRKQVTLLYAAKDDKHNQAIVIKKVLGI